MAAIIFDIDGTIADSFEYVSDFLAGEAKLAPLSAGQRKRLRGLSTIGMARQLSYHWWDAPRLFFRGRRRMQHRINRLEPFAGIPELLVKLHNEGHELFIVSTNSVRNIRAFLKRHGLEKYFLQIYGGVNMFSKRPALRRLLREQHIEAANAVYVCDEVRDVLAAQSAGIRAVAVTWGFANASDLRGLKPTAVAETPSELTAILEEI
jgi:phosphoglycolate phosphatase-like HAD superfamily hydrolase